MQAAAKVFAAPGDALDDRDIFIRVARTLGQPVPYASAADVRAAIAEMLKDNGAYAGLGSITSRGP